MLAIYIAFAYSVDIALRKRFGRVIATMCIFLVATPGFADQADDPSQDAAASAATAEQRFFDWTALAFPAKEYAERRARFLAAFDETKGVVMIPSAHGLSRGETFRQADDFLYFTGLELPGSVLTLDIATGSATLYVPDGDFRFESSSRPNDFPGRPLRTDPALARISGIEDLRAIEQVESALVQWGRNGTFVYVNQGSVGEIRPVATTLIPDWDPQILLLYHLQTTYPSLQLGNAYEAIARTRMVKTELEIATMRRSLAATMSSIRAAALQIRDDVTERDLASAFEGACKANGAQRIPFTIIKSGPNSVWPWRVLASHYDRRNRSMADGELVIFDVGCEVDYYVSDVGRTFPVSGRFSAEQRAVLEMEVAVSDAIIREIRPGITLQELQTIGRANIPEEHKEFMQAGLFFGHHIGLSASDPELPDVPLQAGMIFTVEPWYYNHQTGISVFTEDVVLVTKNGVEVLTSDLPRGTAELERLVRP